MDLRSLSESAIAEMPIDHPDVSTLTTKELQAIVHELRVHQVEMEIQNEELKRVQLELEESRNKYQDKYRDLYDFAPVGYFTLTSKGIIRDVNLRGAMLLGMTRPKLMGRGFGYFVVPESLDRWDQYIITLLGHEEKQTCDLTLRRSDGSSFDVRLDSIRMDEPAGRPGEKGKDHLIRTTVIDITERKRIEEALRESEQRYKAVFDNAAVGIDTLDRHGRITAVNPALSNMLGYTEDELKRLTFNEITHPDDRQISKQNLETLMAGHVDSYRLEKRYLRKGGEIVWGDISTSSIKDAKGNHTGTVGVISDITESKLLQAQLFQSQKMEALGTLVGGIAHDFNNMLQIMIGYCDLLLDDKKKDEPGYQELQSVIETGKGGADLVKKLLAFGQQGQIFPVPLELNHKISQLTTLISHTLPHVVQVDMDLIDGPTTIRADHGQIDQLVMNLAINASEAMPIGGRLNIATTKVSLEDEYCRTHYGAKPGGYVMLTVSDNGCGMDQEILAKVFDPFFSTKERGSTRGTGLGLSVVKGIVQQQGGHVTCESEPGKGTTVKVYFPAVEAPLISVKTAVQTVLSEGTETILVVEDNIPVAELERRFLENAGYEVIVATNGKEALDIYQTRKEEISLVILDLLMPEMSGRDCLMELLKIDPSVKVIIASGYAPEDELLRDISPLVKGFLHKPFAISTLPADVRSVLDSD